MHSEAQWVFLQLQSHRLVTGRTDESESERSQLGKYSASPKSSLRK